MRVYGFSQMVHKGSSMGFDKRLQTGLWLCAKIHTKWCLIRPEVHPENVQSVQPKTSTMIAAPTNYWVWDSGRKELLGGLLPRDICTRFHFRPRYVCSTIYPKGNRFSSVKLIYSDHEDLVRIQLMMWWKGGIEVVSCLSLFYSFQRLRNKSSRGVESVEGSFTTWFCASGCIKRAKRAKEQNLELRKIRNKSPI